MLTISNTPRQIGKPMKDISFLGKTTCIKKVALVQNKKVEKYINVCSEQ